MDMHRSDRAKTIIGTPFSKNAKKVLFLGSGELGKEVVLELQKLGVEVIAVDRYENAPAMQVAQRWYTLSMLDSSALREIIKKEKPDLIVPEIEAIATDLLVELEKEGFTVIPNAHATSVTMNRKRIRSLAAETLGLKTSKYQFAHSFNELKKAVLEIGMPCVVKPIMSSSGKGQSVICTTEDIQKSWEYTQTAGRVEDEAIIVEEFIDFDYEITLLIVRSGNKTYFCAPIGHTQIDGDYRESWQPHPMSDTLRVEGETIAKQITDALGGKGIFGVELFIKNDEVYFSEVSPRPHDTGLVTLISQDLSEFALHARAILDLPIPEINQMGPSASCALLVEGTSKNVQFGNLDKALSYPGTQLRLFGKPEVSGKRRMGVAVALDKTIEDARKKARAVIGDIEVIL